MLKTNILTGTVKFFNVYKGYGFIREGSKGIYTKEHFVHFANISSNDRFRKLEKGDEVSFETKINPKYNKEQAINVKISKKFSRSN